jgi:hypothetical protein
MSSRAIEIFLSRPRIVREEGDRLLPYDDATGKNVVAPVGKLSWGWGFNLMACGSEGLFEVMARYLVTQVDNELSKLPWYASLGSEPTRQSVFLDVAYNAGVAGEVHGFPEMCRYAGLRDWPNCAAQCKVANVNLDASRYAPLRQLLLHGDTPA